jgi:hypothetical protein
MDNNRHYRSFFWPTLLIGVGLVWLLVNLGIIAPFNVSTLLQLWPLLLIIMGLDILLGRRFAWIGSLIGLLAVGGVVAFLILSPKTTVTNETGITTETFSAPVEQTTLVNYNFETASEPVEIYALGQSNNLIDANLSHYGRVGFVDNGTSTRTIHIYEDNTSNDWLNWDFSFNQLKWNIGLNSEIPTNLILDGGSGSINADLSGIQLEELTADLGSGASNFTLPQVENGFAASVDSGSGSVNISLPAETEVKLRLQSGSGAVNVSLPSGAAVRVEVMDSGSGSLHLPNSLTQLSGDNETGNWESTGYANAAIKILIQIINQGSGSISIH